MSRENVINLSLLIKQIDFIESWNHFVWILTEIDFRKISLAKNRHISNQKLDTENTNASEFGHTGHMPSLPVTTISLHFAVRIPVLVSMQQMSCISFSFV